jgi:hypothetical protein
MATKPTMDIYYSSGPAEYQKQLAAYEYEQGDLNARFIDPIRGNVLYSDYLKAPQTYLTEKFNAGTGSYGGTEGWTEKPIPTTSTTPGVLTGEHQMTTTDFAQAYKTQYGVAPTNDQLLAFTAQRQTGATLPSIVKQLPPPSTTITPEGLKQEQGITLPPIDLQEGGTDGLVAQMGQTAKNISSTDLLPEQKQEQSILDEITKLTQENAGLYEQKTKMEQEAGLAQKKADLKVLADKMTEKQVEYDNVRLQQEGKPMTLARLSGSIQQRQNQIASEMMLLQARAKILQGQVDDAQDSINDAIDLKFKIIDSNYKIKQAQLAALQPSLNRAEKARAESLARQYAIEQQTLDNAKATEKQKLDYVAGLMSKYPDAKIGFEDSVADAQIKIAGSKIYQDQIRLLGGKVSTTPSGAIFAPSTLTPTTPPAPAVPKQTFEQFLTQEETKAGMSFGQAKRDELRKQFEASQAVPTAIAKTADLSNYSYRVQEVIRGNLSAESILSGGTEKERALFEKQLIDAQNKGLLKPAPSEKQKAVFNTIVTQYNKSPLIAASDRTIVLKNTIDQINKNPSNGTLQLNLVYSYIQALDTYQSAVREGELGLVNSIDSKVGQLQGYIQKIQNGQIVRPEVAKQIASAAQNLVDTISEGARAKEKGFASQAKVNGIQDLWADFQGGFTSSFEQSTGGIPFSNPTGQLPNGLLFKVLP